MKYLQKELCRSVRVTTLLLTATLLFIVAPRLMADQVEASLIQSIDTSNFPAPDTSGIVYFPYPQDYFLVVDSEVNEMPNIFNDPFNAFKVDRNGILLDYYSTLSFSDEPTGITMNPDNNHCFFSDDNYPRRIHEVDPGNDGLCLTPDDIVTSFVTKNNFGSNDPEDVTYGLNSLFIADGSANRIYRVMPGPNGVYDSVVTGDDLVSSFDTFNIGLTDPEGIVFDPTNNSLFIVGSHSNLIQTTITGELLRTIDLSAINPNRPAGLALAPSSIDSSITSLYMVARGEDNDTDPNENDGMIYELMIPPFPSENQAPIVSAGDDQSISLPNTAQLSGLVSDDNQPSSTYTTTWSKYSGLGEVSFSDPNNLSTLASFSTADTYVLRLTADDGELTGFDDLSIIVTSPSSSPDIRNVPSDYPTIADALSSAAPGDTIVLAPGTYQINETLYIDKNNISIVSNFVTSGDENDIDTTILKGDPAVRLIDGVLGQSANLKLIGLTIIDALKGVTFTDDYGEVHYCKFYNTQEDAISFDTNAGGAVTHTRIENAGDDAIDIDTRYNGSFLIAYNELINSDDDSIEIHFYNSVSNLNMHYDIHDNLFSGAGEDGIQLIDFDADSKRTMDIYRNTFTGMPDVAIGSMFEGTTENFQGTAMTERVRIYNNYFYNNGYHITGGDNMIILNNIFEAATTTAIKRAKGASITDYNIFYNNPTDTEDTLTGSNNLYTNPQRNSDFTLQTGSPAIDAGTANYSHLSEVVLQIPIIEYAGLNPDIGRYEYDMNNTAPVITLFGANPMHLNLDETFTDPGAAATDDIDGNLTADIQVVSNVNTSAIGSYTVTYTVSDSDDNTVSITRTVTVNNGTTGLSFLQSRVSANADDAEEDPDGSVHLNSSDLELVFDKQAQTVGLRFTNLAIPENAVISSAYIQFKVDETDFLADTQLNIAGESTNNAQIFTNTPFNISNRSKTSSSELWSPVAWNTVGASGEDQRTSDLTSIIQEIVSGTGWNSGNAMAFIITGTGKRVAEAYDGDLSGAPLLYVEYTTDANAIAPVLTLLGSNPITLNLGETFTDPGATAVDNEDGDLSTDIQIVSDVNTSAVGTYTVTYTVTDSDDNSASASRSVVVRDNTIAPVLTVNGSNPINLNLGETFTDPGATAVDNEDGNLTTDIQIVSDVNTSAVGTYTVTYTVTDSDDNSVSASRSVVVSDNGLSPVLTLLGANPIKINIGETFTDLGATAMDNEDGDLSTDIQIVSDVNTSAVGTYTITYTVTDSDDNSVSIIRSVIVSDGTVQLTSLQSRVSASANDAEEDPDGSVHLNSSDLELIFDKQAQTVGLRFTNLAIPENAIISSAYIQFKVDETDFLAGTQLNIAGESTNNAQIFTNTAFNISSRSKTNASAPWSPVAWNTTGASGEDQRTSDLTSIVQEIVSETGWNSGNAMAFIITGAGKRVAEAYDGDQAGAPLLYLEYTTDVNAIAPVITLNGANPIPLNLGDNFTDPGAMAQDNEDGDLTTDIQIVSDVNTNAVGNYTVTYTVTDSDQNTTSITRNVVVSDNNTVPVITLNGANPIPLNLGDTFTDPGAMAQDNEDGDLTTDIQIVSDVNTNAVGNYTVTYTVTDSDQNTTSITRSVVVSDSTSGGSFLQSRVSASADDAEEDPDGSVHLNSSDLELVFDKQAQTVGLRFTNLAIPENAVISSAYIQFKVDETDFLADTQLNIAGESTNNAQIFTNTPFNISNRSKTSSSVLWSPVAWNTVGASGEDQRTSDLTSIVQEIVSGTGWSSGNAMAFIITGAGKRVAEAYDGDQAGAPLLYIEYSF